MSTAHAFYVPTVVPLDQTVWLNWLAANRLRERAYFAKRLKIALLVLGIGLAAALVWLFAR